MPGDADVAVVRRFYEAFAAGELDAAGACFTDEVVWHLPGNSPIGGAHRGWAEIRDNFLARLGPLSGGSLRVDLIDVAVGDEFVVAVQHATAERGTARLDITGCQLMRLVDGRIAEVYGHYSNQDAFDRFWVTASLEPLV
jgi:ketosteroid isomerase-like protein